METLTTLLILVIGLAVEVLADAQERMESKYKHKDTNSVGVSEEIVTHSNKNGEGDGHTRTDRALRNR
jgi:hypothetical protein